MPYIATIVILVKTSLFEIFKIGIGPSSSTRWGQCSRRGEFASDLGRKGWLLETRSAEVNLYGSLALTGPGLGEDWALIPDFVETLLR